MLTRSYNLKLLIFGMELVEMTVWIVVGFAPMLGGLELVSRIRKHKVKLAPGHELRRKVEYRI